MDLNRFKVEFTKWCSKVRHKWGKLKLKTNWCVKGFLFTTAGPHHFELVLRLEHHGTFENLLLHNASHYTLQDAAGETYTVSLHHKAYLFTFKVFTMPCTHRHSTDATSSTTTKYCFWFNQRLSWLKLFRDFHDDCVLESHDPPTQPHS